MAKSHRRPRKLILHSLATPLLVIGAYTCGRHLHGKSNHSNLAVDAARPFSFRTGRGASSPTSLSTEPSSAHRLDPTSTTDATGAIHANQSDQLDQSDQSEQSDHSRHTSTFHDRFESIGPTLTLTLRNPFLTSISAGNSNNSHNSHRQRIHSISDQSESKSFTLSSKLGALFRIAKGPAVSSISAASASGGAASSYRFPNGYLREDGEVLLAPPSKIPGEEPRASRASMASRVSFGTSSLSECLQNVHPELRYEIRSRESRDSNRGETWKANGPFPKLIPWLSSISCLTAWHPFPSYKLGYLEGYGHKMMSMPHFVQCGARISLPRVLNWLTPWREGTKGRAVGDMADVADTESVAPSTSSPGTEIDLGVTYRGNLHYPGGTLDLLLGKSKSAKESVTSEISSLSQWDKSLRNNHILLRFATKGAKRTTRTTLKQTNDKNIPSLVSAIQYARATIHCNLPSVLHARCARGVTVTPSFNFVEGKARCVLSGEVGRTGQTSAVLRLDEDDSTLTVLRELDDRKIIAPTISLQTGKIVYDWYIGIGNAKPTATAATTATTASGATTSTRVFRSSFLAHVDPTNEIRLVWTDGIPGGAGRGGRGGDVDESGGGCWVTECRIPLGTVPPGCPIATDVRVGRRWVI